MDLQADQQPCISHMETDTLFIGLVYIMNFESAICDQRKYHKGIVHFISTFSLKIVQSVIKLSLWRIDTVKYALLVICQQVWGISASDMIIRLNSTWNSQEKEMNASYSI